MYNIYNIYNIHIINNIHNIYNICTCCMNIYIFYNYECACVSSFRTSEDFSEFLTGIQPN